MCVHLQSGCTYFGLDMTLADCIRIKKEEEPKAKDVCDHFKTSDYQTLSDKHCMLEGTQICLA